MILKLEDSGVECMEMLGTCNMLVFIACLGLW